MKHLAGKVVWHDRGWDGHICDDPRGNIYCELSSKGKGIKTTKYHKKFGCIALKDSGHDKIIPGKSKNCENENWLFDSDNPLYGAHNYFDQMQDFKNELEEPLGRGDKFLLFPYMDQNNPIDEDNPIMVGVAEVTSMRNVFRKANKDGWVLKLDPNKSFRFPYQEYIKKSLDPGNVAIRVPASLKSKFKYMSSFLEVDDAILLLRIFISRINKIHESGEVEINEFEKNLRFLNGKLEELWEERGELPGLPAMLGYLNCTDPINIYSKIKEEDCEVECYAELLEVLSGKTGYEDTEFLQDYLTDSATKKIKSQFNREDEDVRCFLKNLVVFYNISLRILEEILYYHREEWINLPVVNENPYELCEDFKGLDDERIGFHIIDNGEQKRFNFLQKRFDFDNPYRSRALIVERLLNERSDGGNVFLMGKDIRKYFEDNFRDCYEKVHFYDEMLEDFTEEFAEKLHWDKTEDGIRIFHRKFYEMEKYIEDFIQRRLDHLNDVSSLDLNDRTRGLVERGISIITGPAGSGKTTMVGEIINDLMDQNYITSKILLTPTGKAADRLRKKTGYDAMTIDKLLYRLNWSEEITFDDEQYFIKKNDGEKEYVEMAIIDESSMVDLEKLYRLFNAIDTPELTNVILVGDHNQIPPIELGQSFLDIKEYIKRKFPSAYLELKEIKRTESREIISFSKKFLEIGDDKNFTEFVKTIMNNQAANIKIEYWKEQSDLYQLIDSILDQIIEDNNFEISRNGFEAINKELDLWQIITPYKNNYFGAKGINNYFQRDYKYRIYRSISELFDSKKSSYGRGYHSKSHYNPFRNMSYEFSPGEKIIQVRNNYSKGVFNGETGYFDYFNDSNWAIFEDKEVSYENYGVTNEDINQNLELAYAITVHKAQGSEFNYVIFILPKQPDPLLRRELVYTGITRAKKGMFFLVQDDLRTTLKARHRTMLDRNTSLFSHSG